MTEFKSNLGEVDMAVNVDCRIACYVKLSPKKIQDFPVIAQRSSIYNMRLLLWKHRSSNRREGG